MFLMIFLGGTSFLLSLILTPIIRDQIGHLGFLDHPDGVRKKHSGPVPRVGGMVIALSYLISVGLGFVVPFSYSHVLRDAFPEIWKLSLVASVVFITGMMDDLVGLKAWEKLMGISAAGVLAFWAGIRVDLHLIPVLSTYPWMEFAITFIWLVGCTNAFNLIDGMDGLATGIGLFGSVTVFLAALTQPNLPLALAMIPLIGCLLGFLRYNFNPASVFLGDSGSLLIGFLLGCCGALWSQKSVTLIALTAPMLAISIPLLDVALSIARRFLRNRPIFQGDRGHIHHKLLERGFTHKGTVLVMYGLCVLAATVSLLVSAMRDHIGGLVIVMFCVSTWVGVQYLGYAEFNKAGKMFLKGGFRRIIDAEARLVDFEKSLVRANDLNESWTTIIGGAREFGFQGVRMSVAGVVLEDWTGWNAKPLWQLRIPLTGTQYINFFRDFEAHLDPLILSAFVNSVERGLKENPAVMEPEVRRTEGAREFVYATRASASSAGAETF